MNLKEFKGVIFDMDGTLVDNIKFHKQSWLSFLKKYNIHIESDGFDAQNHGTADEMIVRFFGNNLSIEEIKNLGQEKEKTYRDLYQDHIQEVKGLSNLLKRIKADNIKIGLATMGDTLNIDFILNSLKIEEYFDAVTGGHEVQKGKPNPEIFIKTLEKLELKNTDCIAVEDSMGGIQSAINAGLKVVGLTTAHTREELLKGGCFTTIDDFDELLEVTP